ncbi:penicillin-binding protein PBP2B [Streptococcus hongkongensis]|nr:penicillin-binding protein [Streptococcus uberis]
MVIKNKFESIKFVKKTASITNRIHILFLIIVLLFIALILRLANMQIQDKAFYDAKLKSSTVYTIKSSNPRGKIFDSDGKILVSNDIKDVVTFTRSPKLSANKMKQLVKELSAYVRYPERTVSHRAKIDYYLADPSNYAKVVAKMPKNKKFDNYGNNLKESQVYKNAVAMLNDKKLDYSVNDLKEIAIFNQMNSIATFDTITLKTEELSEEEIAYLVANKAKLPGITVSTDWNRKVEEASLSSIIGQVSSREAGLPQEEATKYIKKGYSLNDRVGTSYLEKAYETVLQGQHGIRQIRTTKSGKIISNQIKRQGKAGKNIKLSISTDFQKDVDNIVKKYLEAEINSGSGKYSEGAYAVAINPKTGSVLAMTGLVHDPETNQLQKNALGTITNVFTPGSVVKGATLASGWENGAISGNQILTDQSIQFGNSKPINSWFTAGQQNISAVQALEYSSNTYMVQVALKMMGQDYHTGMSLTTDGMKTAMSKLRKTYAEFGLGTSTGVDLPGESLGFLTKDYTVSNVVTESFGQYDNYTTMQLAQYVSTIANGGKRIAPHLVEGIYEEKENSVKTGTDNLGQLSQTVTGKELNRVNISEKELALLQEGFFQVVNSPSGFATGKGLLGTNVTISAKTGTAETYIKDNNGNTLDTYNLNVVAYGPSHDPQIAVAIMYPHALDSLTKSHQFMARDIISEYMNKYKK